MTLERLESILRLLGGIAGITTLAIAIGASVIALRRLPAREEPAGRLLLRPLVILGMSAFFIAIAILGWRPLPIQLTPPLRAAASLFGAILLLCGIALYIWGLHSLRSMFAPSSGFAVRIQAAHKLITSGPYAHLRHPMYLGVILATLGTLFLYWTWTGLFFAIAMFGLIVRARREERLLADEFGAEWEAYAARVPMWLPFREIPS